MRYIHNQQLQIIDNLSLKGNIKYSHEFRFRKLMREKHKHSPKIFIILTNTKARYDIHYASLGNVFTNASR